MSSPVHKIGDYKYQIDKDYQAGMRVPGVIFADDKLIEHIISDNAFKQVANVATLPGVERASMESSMAKLMASEAATANALDAIQVHGGYGLSAEYEVGRLLLEAKALEFGEGTSELHRKLIAEFALGMRKQ